MRKESLKTMRLIVPGILILLLFYPLWRGTLDFTELYKIDTKTAIYLVIVAVAGGIYKTLELRGFLFREQLDKVHENIKAKLLAPFAGDAELEPLQQRHPSTFLKVFYNIVDHDPSLTAKTHDIYENGLLWSSYSDLGVISFIGVLLYFLAYVVTANVAFAYFAFGLIGLFFLSIPLILWSVKKHKNLGDDQLDVIVTLHCPRLRELLVSLLHKR